MIKLNDEWGLLVNCEDTINYLNEKDGKAFVHLECFRSDWSYSKNANCIWHFTFRLRESSMRRWCNKCDEHIPPSVVDKARFICGY